MSEESAEVTTKARLAGLSSRRGWLFIGLSFFCGLPACADESGWILTQKSLTFGDQYLYVSKNGLKVYNPRAGFAFVTHAPDWTVVLYNEKTRVYYTTTCDKWRAQMQSRGFGLETQQKNWVKASSSNICGLKATEYKMTGTNTLHAGQKVRSANITDATYWISDDITVPPQLTQLLATAYGLPTTQNIPLKLTYTQAGTPKQVLETYRSQTASIPSSYFVCPSGLTPVKSDAEVMMTDEQKQIIDDMARDLDSSPRSGSGSAAAAAASDPARATTGGAPGGTINVGGVNLDKDKVKRFLDALKNGNK